MDREKLYGGLSTSLLKFVRHLILGNATLKPHRCIQGNLKLIHIVCKMFPKSIMGLVDHCGTSNYC